MATYVVENRNNSALNRVLAHVKLVSIQYALLEIVVWVYFKSCKVLNKVPRGKIFTQKQRMIYLWCEQYFSSEISKYSRRQEESQQDAEKQIVWTCWLQGEDDSPESISFLRSQLRVHIEDRPLVVITEDNFLEYCDIPSIIVDKYKSGIISHQQMTDIIRVALLREHGGLWVDATILVTRDIPEIVFNLPTFTIKGIDLNFIEKYRIIDPDKWMSYFIASKPHSITYDFIWDCLVSYWSSEKTLVDYFFVFYLAKLAREKIALGKTEYDAIPITNAECELMLPCLVKGCSSQKILKLFKGNTWVFKLSWKERYINEDGDDLGLADLLGHYLYSDKK